MQKKKKKIANLWLNISTRRSVSKKAKDSRFSTRQLLKLQPSNRKLYFSSHPCYTFSTSSPRSVTNKLPITYYCFYYTRILVSTDLTFPCEAPGASFLYNGRECLCAWDGRHALCSGGNRASFQDLAREYHAAGKQVFTIADLPELCTPGIVLKDNCNVCICGANEKPACTRMDCEMGWRVSRDVETVTQQEQQRISEFSLFWLFVEVRKWFIAVCELRFCFSSERRGLGSAAAESSILQEPSRVAVLQVF